jgi:hypothetical protein
MCRIWCHHPELTIRQAAYKLYEIYIDAITASNKTLSPEDKHKNAEQIRQFVKDTENEKLFATEPLKALIQSTHWICTQRCKNCDPSMGHHTGFPYIVKIVSKNEEYILMRLSFSEKEYIDGMTKAEFMPNFESINLKTAVLWYYDGPSDPIDPLGIYIP